MYILLHEGFWMFWIFLLLGIEPTALHVLIITLTLSDIPSPRGRFFIYLNIFEIGKCQTVMTGQVVMTLDMIIQACRMVWGGRIPQSQ